MLSKIHFYFFIFKLWAWYCLSIYISSSVDYLLRFIFIFEEQFIFYLLPVGFFTNDKWYFSCLTIARFKIFWRFQITCLHMALVRGSKAPPLTPSLCLDYLLLTCFILPAKYAKQTTAMVMQNSHQVHLQNTVSPNITKIQIPNMASLTPLGRGAKLLEVPLNKNKDK